MSMKCMRYRRWTLVQDDITSDILDKEISSSIAWTSTALRSGLSCTLVAW
jgi:hypothetical protein